jgi:hypothetical protein
MSGFFSGAMEREGQLRERDSINWQATEVCRDGFQ